MFEEKIGELISGIKDLGLKEEEVISKLEIPAQKEFGDFAFPCFFLAAKLKKNPNDIAKHIAEKVMSKRAKEITKVEIKGAYINFFLDSKLIAQKVVNDILEQKEDYGKSEEGKKKKIVIDFSGPNIGKPMHIGHIRSTILGDSLLRIFEHCGYDAKGINYLGDVGLHIGKLIVAYELWLDKNALKSDPVKELLRLYIMFCEKEKTEYQEGIEEEFQDNEWTLKAKEKLKLLEEGDEKTEKIWNDILKSSKKGFNEVYSILNVNFHETTGQSLFSKKGKAIITEALKKGLAKIEDDNAVYVELEPLPKKYVLRANGTAGYITQDLGAAVERYSKYKFDRMIYVTDFRQEMHFKQLFAILSKFGYNFGDKLTHLGFGTVNFGAEIMSTRKGKVILLNDVLAKTVEKADEEIKKRETKGDASKIGVGAVKYAFLKNEPSKDVSFSWEHSLNFEGNTGPYLQYSYARASSILRKSTKKAKAKYIHSLQSDEAELIKKLSRFSSICSKALSELNPSVISNYSFELAQNFSEFYHSSTVIGSPEEEFRLAIIECYMIVIKQCLHLLGIEVMEEM
ncbi:MAG: arginine--tRNA ligase [archaeon]